MELTQNCITSQYLNKGTSLRNVTRYVKEVPLQQLCMAAAEEAIIYVPPNIHSDLFLETQLLFLSIYS